MDAVVMNLDITHIDSEAGEDVNQSLATAVAEVPLAPPDLGNQGSQRDQGAGQLADQPQVP